MSMGPILAIDSATGPCSVALWAGGRVLAYREELAPVMQSARMMPMVAAALHEAGLTYKDVGLVAATVGPGSFTGIRVALAAARGIAFAAGIATAGYTSLAVLAHGCAEPGAVLAVLNAGKGECYYQLFDSGHAHGHDVQLGTPEVALSHAGSAHVVGNLPGMLPPHHPRADVLASLAASGAASQPLSPFYIRPPDAKLPTKKPAKK